MRYAGVAAVGTLWTCVGAGMYLAGLGFLDERPVSYLGTDPRTTLLFRGGLVVAALLVAGFAFYIRDRFRAPDSFLAATLIGLVGQIVAALVPLEGHGIGRDVHVVGGIVLGLSLPVLMWRFAAGPEPGRRRVASYALCWLEVAACVVGIGLSMSGKAPIAEIVPALGFHLWIVVVTVWSGPIESGLASATGAERVGGGEDFERPGRSH
ncbi:MAG: DUF998 domain-containing protein [Acidimicrobiales bacterium]